jgi:hypothetical protein
MQQNSDSIKRDKKIATGWVIKEILGNANAEEKTESFLNSADCESKVQSSGFSYFLRNLVCLYTYL